ATRRSRLLKERSARFFERSVADHYSRIGIRRSRIIHTLYFRSNCIIFGLRSSYVYRRADLHQREKFWSCFAVQSNATVCARIRVDKALVKTVRRRKLAPIPHRVSDIPTSSTASRRNYAIALHAKTVRPRTLVFLFGVNFEVALRRRFRGSPNRTGNRHQATVALHDVNVFF